MARGGGGGGVSCCCDIHDSFHLCGQNLEVRRGRKEGIGSNVMWKGRGDGVGGGGGERGKGVAAFPYLEFLDPACQWVCACMS